MSLSGRKSSGVIEGSDLSSIDGKGLAGTGARAGTGTDRRRRSPPQGERFGRFIERTVGWKGVVRIWVQRTWTVKRNVPAAEGVPCRDHCLTDAARHDGDSGRQSAVINGAGGRAAGRAGSSAGDEWLVICGAHRNVREGIGDDLQRCLCVQEGGNGSRCRQRQGFHGRAVRS